MAIYFTESKCLKTISNKDDKEMSRRYYQDSRSPSAVFVPMPVDRGVLGEKKVEALQRQIERLENDQMKRKELIEQLSKNQDKNQRKHQEKLLVSCDTIMLCNRLKVSALYEYFFCSFFSLQSYFSFACIIKITTTCEQLFFLFFISLKQIF